MLSTSLHVKAGRPFDRRLRIIFSEDRDYWLTTDDFEVRAQIRAGESEYTKLHNDLAEFMTTSMDGADILIDWNMNGEDTRILCSGFYDILISDLGTIDDRAEVVLKGRIWVEPIVTAAEAEGSA